MKSLIFTITFSLVAILCNAQVNTLDTKRGSMDIMLTDESNLSIGIEGSPYIDDKFMPAKVNGKDRIYQMRYNAIKDQMELKTETGGTSILNNSKELYVVKFLGEAGKTYESVPLSISKVGYLVLVWKGEEGTGIYIKEKIKYTPAQPAQNSYQNSKPAKYSRDKDQIMYKPAGQKEMIAIKGKQDIIDLFPDKDVKGFIKKQKLNVKNPEDIAKICSEFTRK